MKKYLIFSFVHYYPSGGLGDCVGSRMTLNGAKEYAKTLNGEHIEILNIETGQYYVLNENGVWEQDIYDL